MGAASVIASAADEGGASVATNMALNNASKAEDLLRPPLPPDDDADDNARRTVAPSPPALAAPSTDPSAGPSVQAPRVGKSIFQFRSLGSSQSLVNLDD